MKQPYSENVCISVNCAFLTGNQKSRYKKTYSLATRSTEKENIKSGRKTTTVFTGKLVLDLEFLYYAIREIFSTSAIFANLIIKPAAPSKHKPILKLVVEHLAQKISRVRS